MKDAEGGGRWQEELFTGMHVLERALVSSAGGTSAKGEHQFWGAAGSNCHLISSNWLSRTPVAHGSQPSGKSESPHCFVVRFRERQKKMMKSTVASFPVIPFKLVKVCT